MRFIVRRTPSRRDGAAELDETEYVEAVKFVRKYGCSVLSRDAYAHLHLLHDSIENGDAGDDHTKTSYISALSSDLRRKCLLAVLVATMFSLILFVLIYLATTQLLKSVAA